MCKKEGKTLYASLDVRKITDNKKFWSTIEPLFLEKVKTKQKSTLAHKKKIISDDIMVAETLNKHFEKAAKDLATINTYFYLTRQMKVVLSKRPYRKV